MNKNILSIYGGEIVYSAAAKCLNLPSLVDLKEQNSDEKTNNIVLTSSDIKITYRREQKRTCVEGLDDNQELALKIIEKISEVEPSAMVSATLEGRFIHFAVEHFKKVFENLS